MENQDFLPLFITEDIYVLNDDLDPDNKVSPDDGSNERAEVNAKTEQHNPVVTKGAETNKVAIVIGQAMQQDEEAFLTKVLQAVGLDIKEVSVLNEAEISNQQVILYEKTMAFGCEQIKVSEQYSKLIYRGTTIISGDAISRIAADTALKKKLWNAMKALFEV